MSESDEQAWMTSKLQEYTTWPRMPYVYVCSVKQVLLITNRQVSWHRGRCQKTSVRRMRCDGWHKRSRLCDDLSLLEARSSLVGVVFGSKVDAHDILQLILAPVEVASFVGHDCSGGTNSKQCVWDEEGTLTSLVPAVRTPRK